MKWPIVAGILVFTLLRAYSGHKDRFAGKEQVQTRSTRSAIAKGVGDSKANPMALLAKEPQVQGSVGNPFEELIKDVLPTYAVWKAKQQAVAELAMLESRRPVGRNSATSIVAGEFETEAEFNQRIERARESDDQRYRGQLANWELRRQQLLAQIRTVESQPPPSPARVAESRNRLSQVPRFEWSIAVPPIQLPYFNRGAMSFDNVNLTPAAFEMPCEGNRNVVAQFIFDGAQCSYIHCSSLERAQQIKRDFASGKARMVFSAVPILAGWQDPIVVSAARTVTVFDKDAFAQELVQAVAAALIRRDSESLITSWNVLNLFKESERAAETRDGVRFVIGMPVVGITLVDSVGGPVEGVSIDQKPPVSDNQFTNSIGMRFVRIPGKGHVSTFWISAFEVTNRQYQKLMNKLPRHSIGKAPDLPVQGLSWYSADAFCTELSAQDPERRRVYRLPSEAEWEFACRAGTTTRFHTGDTLLPSQANFGNRHNGPVKVGSFSPNPFGLFDMHGNVCEWCGVDEEDWMDTKRNREERPLRGGDYMDRAEGCASDSRFTMDRTLGFVNFGFRVVFSD